MDLLERSGPLAALAECRRRAAGGDGGVVLVTGEPDRPMSSRNGSERWPGRSVEEVGAADPAVTDTQILAARLFRKASRKLGEPVEPWIEELADLPPAAWRAPHIASANSDPANGGSAQSQPEADRSE